jgi:hypothetical protein
MGMTGSVGMTRMGQAWDIEDASKTPRVSVLQVVSPETAAGRRVVGNGRP